MRTLSAGLLAAQRASFGTPANVLTVGGTDYAGRIKGLVHQEQPFGGLVTILLDDSDKGITADLRGKEVIIGYGFSGEGSSNAAPLWVLTQRDMSSEGQILTQLQCIDIWQKLGLLRIIGGGGVELKGTITGTFQPGMKVTGQTSGAVATILGSGDDYIWVGKVAKGPFTVAEVVQADISSDSKITVSGVTDISGGGAPAWDGDKTILEIIQQVTSGVVTVVLDSSDGIVDVTKPTYATQTNARVTDVIIDMMSYTKCGIRAENDGKLHIFDITSAPGSPDYSYDTTHIFFTDVRDASLILPNKIIVVNAEQVGTGITPYYGEAEDAPAIARFMEIPQIVFANVQSDADATALASSKLSRIQKEAVRGSTAVPMNCGQELFDYIRITDTRAGIDYYGWVGSLERRWEEGVYRLTIGLGGLVGAVGLPAGTEYPLPNIEESPVPPVGQFPHIPWSIPAAIQGYHHNLHFVASDYNTVTWGAGTIKFYDGTTQAVSAGSYDIPDSSVRYIYFDLDDASPNVLKKTDNYLAALSMKTGVVCMVQRGSDTAVKAMIIPSYGKEPLITADVIYLTGLLDRLPDGTYGKVLATSISAGRILLTTCIGSLDSIGDGSVYQRVRATEISAGYLKLTNQTVKSGEWYNESGVEIDAAHGINIYGAANAFTTRATKTGTIQCYVGADGKIYAGAGAVILDAAGIVIIGEFLRFKYGGVTKGYLSAFSDGLEIGGSSTAKVRLYATDRVFVRSPTASPGGRLDCYYTRGFRIPIDDYITSPEERDFAHDTFGEGRLTIYSNGAWRDNA